MRTPLVVMLLGASLFVGQTAYADPVSAGNIVQLRLTDNSGTALARFSDGGPFRLDLPGTANDFLTFCLEVDEYFTPGENLRVGSVSNQALNGGLNTDAGDPISGTTAFLYTMFRSGNSRYSNGVQLQEAIWYLENERSSVSSSVATLIANAQAEMALNGWGTNDIGDVRVLNLYRGANYATYAQDMLTTQVPEPATLLLMGVGMLMASRSRKRTNKTGV